MLIMECGWIDVNVQMPDKDMFVLVTNAHWDSRHYEAVYHKEKNIFAMSHLPLDVTHWLPIPNPPNKG